MSLTLTRTVTFHARHRLYRPEWSADENRRAFGPLSEEPPHGHDYRCAVTVSGSDAPSDLLVDLAQLDAGMIIYDAFYRWCRDATGETHNWPTNKKSA